MANHEDNTEELWSAHYLFIHQQMDYRAPWLDLI